MTCDDVLSLLPLYRDGECSDARRLDIDAHLDSCERCASEADRFRAVRDAIASARARVPRIADSRALVAAVMTRIEAETATRQDSGTPSRSLLATLFALCETRAVRWAYSSVCVALTALALYQQMDTARCVADIERRMSLHRVGAVHPSGVVRVPAAAAEKAAGTALLATITTMAGASRSGGHIDIPRSSISRIASALRTDPQLARIAGRDAAGELRDLVHRFVSEQHYSIGG
ncbi:MAG: zf-HC2 domain-containing protein [Ignavibacteria bacterium]|nr:zf-HC2 domain-containing protein [Ignavibacteria bacterium]